MIRRVAARMDDEGLADHYDFIIPSIGAVNPALTAMANAIRWACTC